MCNKKELLQKRKHYSVSIERTIAQDMRSAHIKFEPKLSLNGFYREVLDFYIKNHCHECGDVTVKRTSHKCG